MCVRSHSGTPVSVDIENSHAGWVPIDNAQDGEMRRGTDESVEEETGGKVWHPFAGGQNAGQGVKESVIC